MKGDRGSACDLIGFACDLIGFSGARKHCERGSICGHIEGDGTVSERPASDAY